ncbi:MAG: flagellar biosynthetic protein FliO [Proteobacteria bacterium]|nr:flagellar biosynthetic protein FliO [Pseudomonadota bacterium]
MFELDLINTGLKTAAMLLVVLGFLVMALYCMKNFFSPKAVVKGNLFINVLSTLHLSPKERIQVIDISGEKIVLGITPGSINFLTKLNEGNRANHGIDKNHEIQK